MSQAHLREAPAAPVVGSGPEARTAPSVVPPAPPTAPAPAPAAPHGARHAYGLMLAVVIIWGINVSVMKLAVHEVTPLAFNALRFPLGLATMLYFFFRGESDRWPRRDEWLRIVIMGIAAHPMYQFCFLGGLDLTSASHTALIIGITPVWIALGDRFVLREHLPPAAWIGILLSLAGVTWITLIRQGGSAGGTLAGDLLVVASSLLWAFYVIYSRPMLHYRSPIWVTTWAFVIGTPIIVLMGMPDLLLTDYGALTVTTWGGAVYAGLFALATAYSWWAASVKIVGASRTAVFANLIPVFALLVAWIWLGEVLPGPAWIGAGITLVGIWLTTTSRSARR